VSRKSKPVEIIGADIDTLEKDSAFPDAYAFYIRLSDEPDPIWQRYLAEWRNALYAMQRQITVVGDKLRLVFVYGDDIQSCANYAAYLVELINKRIEEYNIQVDIKEKRELAKQEVVLDKEEELRRKLSKLEPVPTPATIEVTVQELLSAYETDEEMANVRYGNKILKITGVVDRIEVKDNFGIYYITLTNAERNLMQVVRCVFDKKHGSDLIRLTPGQTVTVQGKYDGSIVDIRMGNCVLIS
jgi:hypothetical protein